MLGGDFYAFVFEEVLEFIVFVHFTNDIASADKFAFDVELGDGGPVCELFDAVPDFLIIEDVDVFKFYAEVGEDLDDDGGEAASGEGGVAFHVENDVVLGDVFFNAFGCDVLHGLVSLWFGWLLFRDFGLDG